MKQYRRTEPCRSLNIEFLETRALMAATAAIDGFTPSGIRHAYGFDDVTIAGGSVAADGSGQTIAIVDAFNDPNIVADLKAFDTQFGLPAADLSVMNQSGGHSLPTTD